MKNWIKKKQQSSDQTIPSFRPHHIAGIHIALIYVGLAVVWLTGSHQLPADASGSIYFTKDVLFVTVTGLLFYLLITRTHQAIQRSEQTARYSEAQFRLLFDAAPVAISITRQDGTILSVNPLLAEMLGYTVDEIIGRNSAELHGNPTQQAFLQETLQKHGSVKNFGFRVRDKDGKYDWTLMDAELIEFKTETRLISTIRAVNEPRQAIRESEKYYSSLFKTSKEALFVVDSVTGRVEATNPAAQKMYGYTLKEFQQLVPLKLTRDTAGAAVLIGAFQQEHNRPWDYPFGYHKRKDGSLFPVEISSIGFMSEGRHKVFSIIIDASERLYVDRRQRQNATAFESLGDSVIITNAQRIIVAVNEAFTSITGYSKAEVLGQPLSILKSNRHDDAFYFTIWGSINSTGNWHGEIWSQRKNGKSHLGWQTISVIKDTSEEITHYVVAESDISSLKQSQGRLESLAHHDSMTRLPNRLMFSAQLRHALLHAEREQRQPALLLLDLDGFKHINESMGHPAGDEVLAKVAERLLGLMRKEDMVARFSADEFIVLLEDLEHSQSVALVAQKMMDGFDDPFMIHGCELFLSASIGIALYPQDGRDELTLLKNVDAAMYQAKNQGRRNYQFYTAELTTCATERVRLEACMRRAIEREEFQLYYQPQNDLNTGRIIGVEALLRWENEEFGWVPPLKFVPLAEQLGLMLPIGEWVLRTACLQMRSWRELKLPITRISINISGQQIQRKNLLATVQRALDESGLEPEYLELEITETFIMQYADSAIRLLVQLREMGVSLAIDDFGTGYSSLSYLKQLPIHKLKIDRSFISDIICSADDAAITKAIVALGQSLDLRVIAEGIETKEQESLLMALGCNEGQGYYYSPPVPAEAFKHLL